FPGEVATPITLPRDLEISQRRFHSRLCEQPSEPKLPHFLRFQLPGNQWCSIARIPMLASVVSRVMISPTRANCQKDIWTRLAACCSTIKFATELSGVA